MSSRRQQFLRRERVQGELPPPTPKRLPVRRDVVKLYNPFSDEVVELSKDMTCLPQGTQRLEARTADGRYANVSHVNDATVLNVRMRQSPPPGKALVITRRGGRKGTRGSTLGKAWVPNGGTAGKVLTRAKDVGERFRSGFMIHRHELADMSARTGREQMELNGIPGVAGASASLATPMAGMGGASAYLYGRRRGKKKGLAQAGVTKRYEGDPLGRSSADVTRLDHWHKPNPNIPDGARCGRRIVGDPISKAVDEEAAMLARAAGRRRVKAALAPYKATGTGAQIRRAAAASNTGALTRRLGPPPVKPPPV